MRAVVLVFACFILNAQQPETSGLVDALARSAATFARSVPGLTAHETLSQRGRRGSMQVLKTGRNDKLKSIAFTIPDEFQNHEVISEYSFGLAGGSPAFHELRRILTIDGATPASVRHALSMGTLSADDGTKKALLEDLEQTKLQGSVVDFGPMLLLFTAERQRDFSFRSAGRKATDAGSFFVLNYSQTSGATAVTEFREKEETRHPYSGQIWLRETDLVPTKITVRTDEVLTTKYTLSNEAEIDYQPTPYGLAPATVLHRQYLNQDLLVENLFRYTDYHGLSFIP